MKTRYRLTHRGCRGGMFYCVDTKTGKRRSLQTCDEDEARQIIDAWNQAHRQARAIGEVHCVSTFASVYRSAIQSGIGSLNRKAPNREMLRALIWFVYATPAPEMMQALAQLAAWSIDHRTAQANTIGIALAATSSEHAASALRMIETSAKRPSPKTRFPASAGNWAFRDNLFDKVNFLQDASQPLDFDHNGYWPLLPHDFPYGGFHQSIIPSRFI